ncbi:MAG: histidinol-phosphate transaminase [Myxococcota bacterium]
MFESDQITEDGTVELPLNLGLNDGTICPQSCIDVMQSHTARTDLRHYTSPTNQPLLDVISELDGVQPENIFLAHGSGPLLKQCIPHLVRKKIMESPRRIVRHLIRKTGFPIISGRLTYFKIPLKGIKRGFTVHLLPLGPDTGMKLRVEDVEATLKKGDGLVYICNPNNPTGQLMLERDEITYLLGRYPHSLFWVDEAYAQYIPRDEYAYVSDMVPEHKNLLVSRTFSFAYGMAGVRMGYLLSDSDRIATFNSQVTNYRFGSLQEKLASAALTDKDHLNDLREMTAAHRRQMTERLNLYKGVEAFESRTHFILARFTDGRRGQWLAEELDARGIHIKHFVPVGAHRYDEYFRITLGMQAENEYLIQQLNDLLT